MLTPIKSPKYPPKPINKSRPVKSRDSPITPIYKRYQILKSQVKERRRRKYELDVDTL